MNFLTRYRQKLVVEGEDKGLFARILRFFRRLWFVSIFGAAIFLAYGVWVALTNDLSGGASMALIVFPVGALVICVMGAVPYALAQLFLSPESLRAGPRA